MSNQPIISANGFISRDLFDTCDRNSNFYMIGSMGLSSSIALGVALKNPRKKIFVFDGDGNLLMGLSTLATIGALKPKNFIHVVFDNEVYGSTGNQPSYSRIVRLDQVAKSAGYINIERVWEREDIVYEFKDMLNSEGPSFLLIKVNEQIEDADRVEVPGGK